MNRKKTMMINRDDAFGSRLFLWDRKYGDCYLKYSWCWGPEEGMKIQFTGEVLAEKGDPMFSELCLRYASDSDICNSPEDHRFMKGYRNLEEQAKAQAELMFENGNSRA